MRIRCGIPVVLLGEAGCGKTFSISFLARWLGVKLFSLDVHGDTTEADVLNLLRAAEQDPTQEAMVFLDEINACAHLGLIEEILIHRTANGRRIREGLILIAALNPYRVRALAPLDQGEDLGLSFGAPLGMGRNLVYQVHPVPPSLIHLAFDYGALRAQEEDQYIGSMAQTALGASAASLPQVLAGAVQSREVLEACTRWISTAQAYVREKEGDLSAASLRDAQRCLQLTCWFLSLAGSRPKAVEKPFATSCDCLVLGLAFAYMFRLSSRSSRALFWTRLRHAGVKLSFSGSGVYKTEGGFESILRGTQRDFCSRFAIERGVALNEALSENLFLVVVCILNRIPLFLVGRPGTSKTLAIQIAASNLLGQGSPMPFWRRFPALSVFTYQCSPLSTATEIRRQFDVACRFQAHASEQVVVFVLDEVGLAEFSPHLPLKILHSILVDAPIAIVGVSNWTLDRAKMNRAILLTRPEPSVFDLRLTGERIATSMRQEDTREEDDTEWWLEGVAATFHDLVRAQEGGKEFWGMRDFYALVRQLKAAPEVTERVLTVALCRNFGGRPNTLPDLVAKFHRAVFPIRV